jgi:hypothetical protein
MTLSHEPWLVVLSQSLAVCGSHGTELVDRILDSPQASRPRRRPMRADLILAVGVLLGCLLGMIGARFTSQSTDGSRTSAFPFAHPVSGFSQW